MKTRSEFLRSCSYILVALLGVLCFTGDAYSVYTTDCSGEQKSSFGRNDTVCLSGGALTKISFYDIVPCADAYIMENRIWNGGELLADGMGSENRVCNWLMGGFLDEVIALPPLPVGLWDLVMDEDGNGVLNGVDQVQGSGAESAFEVVDYGHPLIDSQELKASAAVISGKHAASITMWNTAMDAVGAIDVAMKLWAGKGTGAAISVFGKIVGVPTSYNGYVIGEGRNFIGAFDPHSTPQKASGILGTAAKHWWDLHEDPPDANYTVLAPLDFSAINAELAAKSVTGAYPFQVQGSDPREAVLIRFANRAVEQAALVKALRQSFEKYQGAAAASDYEHAFRQIEQAKEYGEWLAGNLQAMKGDLLNVKQVFASYGSADTVHRVAEMQALKDRVTASGLTPEEIQSLKDAGLSDARVELLTQYVKALEVPAADFSLSSSINTFTADIEAAIPVLQSFNADALAAMNNLVTEFTPHHPRADAGGPYLGNAGSQLTLSGAGSSDPDVGDPLGYAWDLDGDGLFDDATGAVILQAWNTPVSGFVGLKVTDAAGNSSVGYAQLVVSAGNAPPVIASFTPSALSLSASVLRPVTFSVAATDADNDPLSYEWTLDGIAVGSDASYTLTPGASDSGIKQVLVTIRDNNAASRDTIEGRTVKVYADADLDGYDSLVDCNDSDPTAHPGAAEIVNNGKDDDCNAASADFVCGGLPPSTFYRDADGDGFGNPAQSAQACSAPEGYLADNRDCNDADAAVHPGAGELCNGRDDNCNGQTDEGVTTTFYTDGDGDGYGSPAPVLQACAAPAGHSANGTDCNDASAAINPGALETIYDGVDNDCNAATPDGIDADADGFTNNLDCNDNDPNIGPPSQRFYSDADQDGFGNPALSALACSAPVGHVANNLDCNDASATVGAATQAFYRDADADGFGNPNLSVVACSASAGYVANNLDCNDSDPAILNTLTTYYQDTDGDGFGDPGTSIQACQQPSGYLSIALDCDDANPYINPGGSEIVHNGKDDDCKAATPDNWSRSFVLGIDDASWIYYAKSDGDGTFSDYRKTDLYLGGGTSRGIVIEDFDGDGDLDFIAGRGNGSFYLYSNDGSDKFGFKGVVGTHPNSGGYAMDMAAGDFNNDGRTDFAANGNTNVTAFFLNDGKGGFTRTSLTLPALGRGLDTGDFNHDGNLDFAVSLSGNNDVWVYQGDGTGKFTGAKIGSATSLAADNYALAAADFDNDGNVDVIVSGSSNGDAYIFKGKDDGTFNTPVPVPTLDTNRHTSMDAYDFNNDGKSDIVLSDYNGYRMWFYAGNGDGTFGTAAQISTSATGSAILSIAAPPAPNPGSFPVADAEPKLRSVHLGESASLTGSYSIDPGKIASYSWDFGDAATDTGASVGHIYASEGQFLSTLSVVDQQGRKDRDFARVTVSGNPPLANAGGPYSIGEADASKGRYNARLDGSASSDDFGIVRYEWTLGDPRSDSFDADADRWTPNAVAPNAGTWSVNAGAYQQSNATPDRTDTFTSNVNSGDYTVEADVMLVSGGGQEALLLFRALDANNHYEFIFRGRTLNDLLLYRQQNGNFTQLATVNLPFASQLNTWYRLKVEAYKSSIKCYVDDVLYIDHTDATFANGMVGLSTYRSAAKFDNFKVASVRSGVTPEFLIPEGSFSATLKVTDKAGQSATAATQVTAAQGSAPVANAGGPYIFGESLANQNKWTVTLDGSASSDDTGIESYAWNFGDNSTGTGAKPGHVYTGAGTYNVTLTVTDRAGLTSTTSTTVTTKGDGKPVSHPGSSYSVNESAAAAGKWTVNFDGRGSSDDRGIYDYRWNFGDGATGTGATPVHQYGAAGSYTVTLTVRDHAFQSDSKTTTVTVSTNGLPVAAAGGPYTVDEAAAKDGKWTVIFDGSGSSDDFGIWKYDWNFGDGTTGSGATPTHLYSAAGSYTATLTVTDNGKQIHSATAQATVAGSQPPVAQAGPDKTTEVGFPVVLDAGASSDDFGIYSYRWDLGVPSWTFSNFERSGDEALITGDYSNWNTRYLVSDSALPRNAGDSYTGRVMLNGTSNGNRHLMWGLKNTGSDNNQTQFYHAIYFNNGAVNVYESGNNRGSFGSFANSTSYDVRIDVKSSGAIYYYRATGAAAWTKLYESTFSSASPLRVGATVHSGLFSLSGFTSPAGALQLPPSPVINRAAVTATYNLPGTYGAAVTVMDHAQQSVTDSALVTVVAGEPPVANTGGPYLSNEDIPTRFNAQASSDDYGIKWYRWDFGDGEGLTTRNPWVDHRYVTAGVYTVTLTVTDYAGHEAADITTVTVSAAPVAACVPWQYSGSSEMPHDTWSGKEITLKGVSWSNHPPLTYQWDFGDGSAPVTGTVIDKLAIQAKHSYTGVDGQPFTATLTVTDANGNSSSDDYPVRIRAKSVDVEINVAIDEGLWWLHVNQNRSFFAKGVYGNAVIDAGYWDNAGGWNGDAGGGINGLYTSSPTASAIQAFQVNGHLELGDVRKNPYVETVARGLRFTTTRLAPAAIGSQTYGDPDSNVNGIGVQTVEARPMYEMGQVMDSIIASGSRSSYAITGPAGVAGRSYFDLVTDMVDMYAWGQTDYTSSQGGGWQYSWNSGIDNSAAQWGAIGMLAAEEVWKIQSPKWVKERNNVWMSYSYNGTGFGYTGPGHGVNTTPSGLVQLAFDDMTGYDDPATAQDDRDPRWRTAEDYIANNWSTTWWYPNSSTNHRFTYYGYYAFAKAMRSAKPKPVVNLKATGLDWYKDDTKGMARRLINRQQSNGSWPMDSEPGSYVGHDLTTAWSVIILTPTLFVQPPVADAGEDRVWGVDVPLTLDGSRSYHLDPFRNITLYEWDLDGDGSFDTSSADPKTTYTYTRTAYPENTLPRVLTVTLRVTDDNDPAKSSTDATKITIAVPPHPPVANAGGPYTCFTGVTCRLDGSGSMDIDPSDIITAWEWDLNGDRVYGDSTGEQPETVYGTPGIRNIGLRVTDNGVMNNGVRLEAFAFTTVNVAQNRAPAADAGGPYATVEGWTVQLDGSGSSDPDGNPLSYAWDLDNDGSFETTGVKPSFSPADNGSFTVRLKVSDGPLEATATATVTVANQAPSVNPVPGATINEGESYAAAGSFSDPGADSWTATVDYGDGSGVQPLALSGKGFNLSHLYTRDGVYTVTVSVSDDDGGTGSATGSVTVRNVAPAVNAGPDAAISAGGTFTSSGSFTDPGSDSWSATVDYGDGTGVQALALAANKTFTLSHGYATPGAYSATVTVQDSSGAAGSDSAVVTVATASCLTTLTARAKTRMVQLNWSASEHTATTRYDIYRSTQGPNSGFTRIRTGYTNIYPVFVDSGLTNGTTYYYRIERSLAPTGSGYCSSKVVSARPVSLF